MPLLAQLQNRGSGALVQHRPSPAQSVRPSVGFRAKTDVDSGRRYRQSAGSADKPDSGDGEPAAGTPWSRKCREFLEFLGCLDFWEELKNLYQGPWEWLLPEAQASKGTTCVPLRGTLYAQAELRI